MSATKCTAECNALFATWAHELMTWEATYQNYCVSCKGLGGEVVRYDPSPAGVSLSPGHMEDFDPCTECLTKGKCGRCGEYSIPDDETDTCTKCGWVAGSQKMARPLPPECSCWEEQMAIDFKPAGERIDDNAKTRALQNKRPRGSGPRALHEIAKEIRDTWKPVYFAAKPYLEALSELTLISDAYYEDSARSMVAYFLSNAKTWKGDVARRIKKELNDMMNKYDKEKRK